MPAGPVWSLPRCPVRPGWARCSGPGLTGCPARKLWIAFALGASGRLVVDEGAQRALAEGGRSLLTAGVVQAEGEFNPEDAVEIAGPDGKVFAKGLVRLRSEQCVGLAGAPHGPVARRTCRPSPSTATTWCLYADFGDHHGP